MPLKLRDIPMFPSYVEGQTDHDFMMAAWNQGPFAKDKFGIVTAFSAAHMTELADERFTRQIETEGLRMSGVTSGPMYDFISNALLFQNGQRHRDMRGPLVRTFAHKVIADLRPHVRARAETMVRSLVGGGRTDFVNEFAGPLPAQVIAAVLGVPEEDAPRFTKHVYSAIRGLSLVSPEVREESDADLYLLTKYVAGLLADRDASPLDDFLTDYLAKVPGGNMDEVEIRTQIVALVLAGSDTTRGGLTATLSYLLQHRDQWELLVSDPDTWVPSAVNEGLRYDPVIGSLPRIVTEPHELGGVLFPEGALVASSMLTALRDPAVYDAPNRFDITRTDHPRLHPIFGSGPHRCLGEALARIELEEGLRAWATVAPHTVLDGAPIKMRGYGAVRQITPLAINL
ncbi:MAG: cytochrome P450 [Pseudomonadota bacterium]